VNMTAESRTSTRDLVERPKTDLTAFLLFSA
jgi:hypothetical protein